MAAALAALQMPTPPPREGPPRRRRRQQPQQKRPRMQGGVPTCCPALLSCACHDFLCSCVCAAVGDVLCVLHDLVEFSPKAPIINDIAKDIYVARPTGIDFCGCASQERVADWCATEASFTIEDRGAIGTHGPGPRKGALSSARGSGCAPPPPPHTLWSVFSRPTTPETTWPVLVRDAQACSCRVGSLHCGTCKAIGISVGVVHECGAGLGGWGVRWGAG